jgi:hypothetical protein
MGKARDAPTTVDRDLYLRGAVHSEACLFGRHS